jgi:hypothetical protein
MHSLPSLVLGAATVLVLCDACGGSNPASICGSERPCLPEGTWIVSYDMALSGYSFSSNTIRIDAEGTEVIGEGVPDDTCGTSPEPGLLMTDALLSADGCSLTAMISKNWCESGEANCEDRRITLDFCDNGSTTVATGSLVVFVCWLTDGPSCSTVENYVTVNATATRMIQ